MIDDQPNATPAQDDGFTSTARRKAIDAYDGARGSVNYAGRRAADTVSEAPLIALAGGLAAGALLAALLPRTEAERRALRPVGRKLSESTRAAAQAAKEAGTSRLDELGLTPEKGKETLHSIFEGAGDAAKASAQAAVSAARKE